MITPTQHNLASIGLFQCTQKYRYDVPRQGVLQKNKNLGRIILHGDINFSQALTKLAEFDRIWLIFSFHQNQNFREMVNPPRNSETKVGVFASRSPHRPNGLGLSCVKLEEVQTKKKVIVVSEFDLIDQTPIFDIKPYLPYSDSFPHASAGWTIGDEEIWKIEISKLSSSKLVWLGQNQCEMQDFIFTQLEYQPTNKKRKRIKQIAENIFVLSYRTWRIQFEIKQNLRQLKISDIFSGYSQRELNDVSDVYNDKNLHRLFNQDFNNKL